ncbi:related to ER-localized J domain-containing protein 5 [Saccharomycodes ludwigii]|uniref:Related to ER-localized J domain-containing protein 5 n=1 Tax=Saccharomycodes ludwigii TaxID=36035 RepID=A0A376B4L4_9ASCO|nr:hypothetical protein SCDLUD_002283 [Saccharomycodes ludwigii]KAH3900830.1 hypothetical protein SCDLUD_002283 [Saccharomycodes ludwigii]SSD59404.1 related to ER-localized J domain-containing protein 5 [Saccharomycodes ludwigii]
MLKLPKLDKSSEIDIKKQFRKLSRKYHPDKNIKYRKLYERLNGAKKILLDAEQRKAYDYYLSHGFPDYNFSKGGFYFSNRIKPSSLLLFIVVYFLVGAIHYVLLRLQVNSKRSRYQNFIDEIKKQDDSNGLGIRDLKFQTPDLHKNIDEYDVVRIKFGDVYYVNKETGTEHLMDVETEIPKSSIYQCFWFAFPKSCFHLLTLGKFKRDAQHGTETAKPKIKKG